MAVSCAYYARLEVIVGICRAGGWHAPAYRLSLALTLCYDSSNKGRWLVGRLTIAARWRCQSDTPMPNRPLPTKDTQLQSDHTPPRQPVRFTKIHQWRIGFGLGFIMLCTTCGILLFKYHPVVTAAVADAGSWGWIAFSAFLSIAVVLLLPTPFIKIFAGVLFPLPIAILVNFVGTMLGGIIAFLFGRWLLRDMLISTIAHDPKLQRIDAAIGKRSLLISTLIRLSPLLPDEWLNYILASGPVTLKTFIISNCSSIILCSIYAYYGWAFGQFALKKEGLDSFISSTNGMAMLIGGLIATMIAGAIIVRITVRILSRTVEDTQ